ncbi:Dihydroxy-acid dehydratase [Caballeronia sordidicola]|uniref:Dihydroxy-acid dehydratase n=1 Tax=Caballeronia sordidicola TaxID=196367 RepID=A0A242M9K4_CABSO|nr:Dihydroxy-acid dehydratase [Caballeronia sordidicola]
MVLINAREGVLRVELSDEELAPRRAAMPERPKRRLAGVLEKYEALVRPAHLGAVTHSGNLDWPYDAPTHGDDGTAA